MRQTVEDQYEYFNSLTSPSWANVDGLLNNIGVRAGVKFHLEGEVHSHNKEGILEKQVFYTAQGSEENCIIFAKNVEKILTKLNNCHEIALKDEQMKKLYCKGVN